MAGRPERQGTYCAKIPELRIRRAPLSITHDWSEKEWRARAIRGRNPVPGGSKLLELIWAAYRQHAGRWLVLIRLVIWPGELKNIAPMPVN
jgi:hypothetical protein